MPIATIRAGGVDYPFIALSGVLQEPGQTVEILERDGTDGESYRLFGKHSEITDLIGTVDLATAGTMRVLAEDLAALQGSIVTIFDDNGQQYDEVMLLRVSKINQQRVGASIGGTQTIGTAEQLASFRFEVQISTTE